MYEGIRSEAARYRILYVDDDRDLTALVATVLGRRGFEVICRETFDDARHEVGQGVDAVMADLRLSRADGLALCQELRAAHPSLPILIISGDQSARERVEGDGFVFLLKPVSLSDLEEHLHRAIAAASG